MVGVAKGTSFYEIAGVRRFCFVICNRTASPCQCVCVVCRCSALSVLLQAHHFRLILGDSQPVRKKQHSSQRFFITLLPTTNE